jgi:hypothetical protein
MKKIAHAKDGIVYVNSGLNEIMFAKTKFTTLDTSSFQNFWNSLSNDAKSMVNR